MKKTVIALMMLFLLSGTCLFAADTQLVVWVFAWDPHINGLKAAAEAYKQVNPNVTLKIETQADIDTAVKTGASTGNVADILFFPGYEYLVYGSGGILAPLDDVITPAEMKAKWWPEYTLQNPFPHTYAVAISDNPGDAGIVVNKKMLDEAGLKIPEAFESMDQMLDYAKKLKKVDANGKLIRAGLSIRESNDPHYFMSWIADQGGKFFDNKTKFFNFNTPEAKNVLQLWYDMMWKYNLDSNDLPDTFTALSQNVAAMGILWGEYIIWAKANLPDTEWAFIMKPHFLGKGRKASFSHSDIWDIGAYAKGKNLKDTKEFLRFWIKPETQRIIMKACPGISPLKELIKEPYFDSPDGRWMKPIVNAVTQAKYWGPFGDYGSIRVKIWELMEKVLLKNITVDAALATMTTDCNAILERYYKANPDVPKATISW